MFQILLLLNLHPSNLNYGHVFLVLVEIVIFVILEFVKSLALLCKCCYIVNVKCGEGSYLLTTKDPPGTC